MGVINAADYDSLSDAIRAAALRKLYIPYDLGGKHTSGGWFAPDANGWTLDQPIEIFGDGDSGEDVGLRYWADPNVPELRGTGDSTIFNIASGHVYLHDLVLSNDRGKVSGTGNAIQFIAPIVVHNFTLDRVSILYAGNTGILCQPAHGPTDNNFIIVSEWDNVTIYGCGGRGIDIQRASTTLNFKNINIVECGGVGLNVVGCITSDFSNIISENNGQTQSSDPYPSAIYLQDCWSSKLKVHIEQFANTNYVNGITFNSCHACKLEVGGIFDYHNRTDLTGVNLVGATSQCVIEPQHFDGVTTYVTIPHPSVSNTIYPQLHSPSLVGFGVPSFSPPPSGALPGTILYDSAQAKLRYFNGSSWKTVKSG